MLCWSWLPCQSWRKLRLMEEVTYAPHQGWCNSCYEWRDLRSKQEIMTCLRGVLRHLICQKLSILIYCKCFKLLEVFKAVYRYFCLLPCSVFIFSSWNVHLLPRFSFWTSRINHCLMTCSLFLAIQISHEKAVRFTSLFHVLHIYFISKASSIYFLFHCA